MSGPFGLDCGGEILCADETPIEVLGVVKFLNADGQVDYYPFCSATLDAVQAIGMAEYLRIKCRGDVETAMMLSFTAEVDDHDD